MTRDHLGHLGDELSGLLDGELAPADAAAARAHLAECAFCTAELAAFDRARSAVRSLPMVEPLRPLGLRALPASVAPWRPSLAPLAAAAAALFVVGLSWMPADRSIAPRVAGLVAAHAQSGVQTPNGHVRVESGEGQAEFDVVPVVDGLVPLAPKFTVSTRPESTVAGRPTIELELDRQGAIERVSLDAETGAVLRREVLDREGRVVSRMEVEHLFDTTSATIARPLRGDALVGAPDVLPGNYERVGTYRRGHVVHVLYSDGLHTLSVFVEAGDLAEHRLPAGGRQVAVGPGQAEARHYGWPGGDVLLWERDGIVYTVVGDAPVEEVTAAAASMPGPKSPPLVERLRRAGRTLVETVTGGP
jgi:anti-sigma factor RsiW